MLSESGASGRHAASIAAVAALLFLPGLGALDLWAPDEPRYAQISEELRAGGHGAAGLLVLRLNGEVYTQKPPLYYWLAALVGSPGGRVTEAAARAPSALAAIATAVLTAALASALLRSPRAGLLAAAVLLTVPRFAHQARRAQLDVLLTLCELIALLAYWAIEREGSGGHRPRARWLALLHGATALALLTKGPVGALPWAVIALHRVWERRAGSLRLLFPIWGVALAALPALAWVTVVTLATPAGYVDDAVVDNVLARFFVGTDHVRPFYYFVYTLPLDLLPWTPAVLAGAAIAWSRARSGSEASAERLLLAWLAVFFVFFSISAGKRGLYMLPLFPGAAALAALALERWIEDGRVPRLVAAPCALLFAAVAVGGLLVAVRAPVLPDPAALPRALGWTAVVAGALGIAACLGPQPRAVLARIALFGGAVAMIELATFHLAFPALDDDKSPRPIATAAAALAPTHERVGVFRNSALTGGLEYYAGRRAVRLESPTDVRAFLAAGDRLVVVRQRDRAALDEIASGRLRGTMREGRRALELVELRGAAAGATDVDRDQPAM